MMRSVRLLAIAVAFRLVFSGLACLGQSRELKFDHITSENGLPQNTIHGIVKDKYGFMWFGTWAGLCRYDGYKFKVYRYEPGNARSINNNRIHNIIKDKDQNLWIQTFEEATPCRYNYETDDFERVPLTKLRPEFVKLLNRWQHYHKISVTFKDYRWKIDPYSNSLVETYLPTGKVRQLSSNPVTRWDLNDSYVADIYLDNHNIFWVGTYGNGINKANLNSKPFNYFYHDPQNRNSILDNNVSAISEDKLGNFWIGTKNKGITIVNKNGTYQHLQHSAVNTNTIIYDQVRKIFCDSRGLVWIGTKQGVDRYDHATGSIRHFEMLNLKKTAVFGIMEDHANNIWLGTWKGVYKYNVKNDQWLHFEPSGTTANTHVKTVMEDHLRQIWVGTDGNGISLLKEASSGNISVIRRFKHNGNAANSISNDRITGIFEDSEHFIWIGTEGGLNRFDPRTAVFKHFSVSPDGLANESIAAILEDNNGFIWVSHKKGISQINKKTFAVRNYSVQDGLQSNEFVEAAAYKSTSTGMLYFGGSNGYNAFYPQGINPDRNLPKVVFTELQVLNKPVKINEEVNGRILLKKPLYLTKEIDLVYADKSIVLEFAALHYANPSGNQYAYRLEGFDRDWIYTDASQRSATYSNLEPGDYVFKVKASNSDGIWNPVPTTLNISVAPAFWVSAWAYLFYTIVLALMLYAFYYYSVRYARLKSTLTYEAIIHEKELELQKNKIDFFTNISHEIKTPLSLILAPIERLMSFRNTDPAVDNQLKVMKNSGDRLLKLINQLLDIRRFETGNDPLSPERADIVTFARSIVDTFRQLALQRTIDLQFISFPAPFYLSFDPDKVEKILYNLLSNSFKFTPDGGMIQVRINGNTNVPEVVTIEVTDNGNGIPAEDIERIFKPFQQGSLNKAGGTGLGLAYSKALAEQHGGTIAVESSTNLGKDNRTTFTVTLPVDRSAAGIPEGKSMVPQPMVTDDESKDIAATPGAGNVSPAILNKDEQPSKLLLVEDNFEMRKYLKDYLAEHYEIIEAANGREGLEMAARQSPDLVISDVMMPEMDGIEFCRILKSDMMTSHIPVILLTARTSFESQVGGLETGADDYVMKPFNLTLLSLKINNLLVSRARLREHYKAQVTVEPSTFNAVSPDEKLLKKVFSYIEEKISDPHLSIDEICDKIGISKTNLYRKVKALTGLNTVELIKDFRLKRARQLLREGKFNISEISYMAGFTDVAYFRKCFKAAFHLAPSEYAKQQEDGGDGRKS